MHMRIAPFPVVASAVLVLAGAQVQAGVRVSQAQPTEQQVAFQAGEGKFITASPGNYLDLSGSKIGSKQTFTFVDLNGEQLADGDDVKIRYTPNSGGAPDASKASYWMEVKEGVKRGKEGDVFKIKRVGTKYALLAPSGKFVGAPVAGGMLGVTDKEDAALVVELVDLSQGKPKAHKQPTAQSSDTPASQ